MIKNILLATDGSSQASNALDLAIDLAAKYGASLTLVHVLTHDHPAAELQRMLKVEHLDDPIPVHKNPPRSTSTAVGLFLRGEIEDQELRAIAVLGEKIIRTATKKAEQKGIKNIKTNIQEGDYANCILNVASTENTDLIVMGRRGLSRLKGFVTGSVSHKVSQRANCSVLTVM
jgi:nucleotide-binding universal stress UspA family protein